MYKKCKKLIVWCLITCMVLTQTYFTGFAASGVSLQKRLSGNDRYKTAVAISQNGWKTSQYAVLARGDDYADALCAGPLAKKYGAPILLTQTEELNPDALSELKRLGVNNVFIVGGYGAVSSSVESSLTAAGIKYERIYGSDRYETSTKIAEKLGAVNKIVLATGSDFPDALSISAVASKLGMPILLTGKDTLPDKVKQYISGKQITQTYVIGGIGVISSTALSLVPGAVRLGGNDRFETNTKVMENFKKDLNFSNIYVAIGDGPSGDEFADALSGAVLAAKTGSPVVLTAKALPAITENYLKTKVVLGTKVVALGGEAVVPQTVIDSIAALVDKIEVKATYSKAGTYGPKSGTETIAGNVVISARDVILQNTIIEGDLLLAESIGDGNVTLKGVTVKGSTVVRGGGPNSIIMYNFNGQTVTVDVPDGSSVRLVAQGSTSVGSVTMGSDGKLEESGLTGTGFTTVEIPAGATVTLSGDFDSVNVEAAGASVNVENGRINTLNVTESASNAGINIAGTASVNTLTANAPVGVTGTGSITTANVNSEGVSIVQTPTTTTVSNGVTATVGGSIVNGTPQAAPAGGGGGGGDSTPTVSVSGVSVSNATTVEVTMAQLNGATFTWNGAPVTATYSSGKYALTVPLMISGTNNTLVIAKSGYNSYSNNAIVWTDPLTYVVSNLGEWVNDRTEPKAWNITDNWITLTTKTEPNNNWYAWQGKKTATNNAVTSNWRAETEIELTEELLARDGVRTSMWLNVQKPAGGDLDWSILQFKIDNTNQTKGWQWWNSNSGLWVNINGVSTTAGTYKFAIYFDSGTITQYINGIKVNEYTTGSDKLSSVKEVIFNSYSFGAEYTTKWKVPTVKYVDKYPVGTKFVSTVGELKTAIANATENQTIYIASDLLITSPVTVGKTVTIKSLPGIKITTTGAENAFILSNGAILDGLAIEKTDNANQDIVYMKSDTSVINSTFKGQYTLESNTGITRAILAETGATNLTISNSKIDNLRQPAYINGGVTGNIAQNTVNNTRGWVVCGNSNVTLTSNVFGTNAVDIAIIKNDEGGTNNYPDVAALSTANNGAFVENQLSGISAINGKAVIGNVQALLTAITSAEDNATLELAPATFNINQTLHTSKPLIIKGAGMGRTILDVTGVPNGAWGVLINKSNTTLSDMTIKSNKTANYNNNLKVSDEGSTPIGHLTGIVIRNISIQGGKGLDIHNAEAIVDHVTIENSKGASIAVSNNANVTITNTTTTNGAWGSLGVMFRTGEPKSTTTIGAGNTFNEGVLYTEEYSTIENVITGLGNTWSSYVSEGNQMVYTNNLQNVAYRTVNGINYGYSTIQAAVTAAVAGDTIYVTAGKYTINSVLNITKNITINGIGVVTFESTGSNSILQPGTAGVKLTVSNIAFKGTKANQQRAIDMVAGTEAVVTNCTFDTLHGGMYANPGAKINLTNSTFRNVVAGIGTETATANLAISINIFESTCTEAVGFTASQDTQANYDTWKASIIANNTGAEGKVNSYGTFASE